MEIEIRKSGKEMLGERNNTFVRILPELPPPNTVEQYWQILETKSILQYDRIKHFGVWLFIIRTW